VHEQIRKLIDRIVLTPNANVKSLKIDLYGKISALFALASEYKNEMSIQKHERPASNDVAYVDKVGCGSRI
jgi:hypothetical protein